MEVLETAIGQGIAPAIIVAIYLIIIKLIDNVKEKKQIKINDELVKSINKISDYIDDINKDKNHREEDKTENAVKTVLMSSAYRLGDFATTTIINNNININKDVIISNINNLVNSEFFNCFNVLSLYRVNGVRISTYLNKNWAKSVIDDIIEIIFTENVSKEIKILNVSKKINIKFNKYITEVLNNIKI